DHVDSVALEGLVGFRRGCVAGEGHREVEAQAVFVPIYHEYLLVDLGAGLGAESVKVFHRRGLERTIAVAAEGRANLLDNLFADIHVLRAYVPRYLRSIHESGLGG